MTIAALVLLAAAALIAPARLVGRWFVADPTVVLAAATSLLLAVSALLAAYSDTVTGTRRGFALVLGVVAGVVGGSDVVRATFRLMRGQLGLSPPVDQQWRPRGAESPDDVGLAPDDVSPAAAVLRGGAWIGYLERGAIAATLLAGWPEGIALVLAVKGVGRYPELRGARSTEAHASEAFIIGTLVSVLWAAAAAGTVVLLLR